jgi:hypothetical protein
VVAVDPTNPDILLVAVSSTVSGQVQDRIQLPDRSTQPQTTSGLWEQCWAVPEWYLYVPATRLGEKIGYIGGEKLRQVAKAVQVHIAAGKRPVEDRGRQDEE